MIAPPSRGFEEEVNLTKYPSYVEAIKPGKPMDLGKVRKKLEATLLHGNATDERYTSSQDFAKVRSRSRLC